MAVWRYALRLANRLGLQAAADKMGYNPETFGVKVNACIQAAALKRGCHEIRTVGGQFYRYVNNRWVVVARGQVRRRDPVTLRVICPRG